MATKAMGMGMGTPLTLPAQPAPGVPFQPAGGNQAAGIAAGLPFGAMGANATLPHDLASLGTHYANAYNSALAVNSSNYTNILAGYQQTRAQQVAAQDAIAGGYTGLYNDVIGQLGQQGAGQRAMINRDYAAQLGRQSQQLIDRGLGNSTIQSSVERGLEFDRALAGNQLNEQVARQYADYASRLGLAGLDYRDRANMQNTQLAGRQMDWMNSVMAPYPDAGVYAQLAQQYGMAEEAKRNREQMAAGGGRQTMPAGMSGGLSGVYGTHFPRGFSGGEAGGAVQVGGGGGGYGNVAGGIGAYVNPGQNFGGGYDYGYTASAPAAAPSYDVSGVPVGGAAVGAAGGGYAAEDLSALYGVPGVGSAVAGADFLYDPLY
jgi:hypothetical protein